MISNSRRSRGCATSQTTLVAVALLTFMGAGILWSGAGKATAKTPGHKTPAAPEMLARVADSAPSVIQARSLVANTVATAKLPIAFEPNQGQTDSRAAYLAHGAGYGLFLTSNETILALGGTDANSGSAAVRMQLEGAAASPKITASEPLPGKSNYFRGNDPSRWVRNVPTFARVQYSAVYPGIDLVYYGKQGQLEYDFAVHSGADPRQIRFQLAGVDHVSVGADGSLRLKTAVREVRWNKPAVYQEVGGRRQAVSGRFQLLGRNRVGFALGRYDRSRDLVIDPLLAYATYFGGAGDELNPRVAVDANSNIYLAGTTTSGTSFPIPACTGTCPAALAVNGTTDVFVSKLDSFGTSVSYTTFINGSTLATGTDSAAGLAVDSAGNVYVTGTTNSADFPTTIISYQSAPKAPGQHVFITKLDSTGANLQYSSYLSGTNTDNALAVAADNIGNAYILGWTQSVTDGDFPVGNSFQQSANGATRLYFVSKFDTTQTAGPASLKFFSYLGGTLTNSGVAGDGVVCVQLPCGGIALDTTGNAYVAIGTTFTNLPATSAFQTTNHGGSDAFLTKISADGSALQYSTYLGGTGDDVANSLALDSSGNAYLTGSTTSSDFPAGTSGGLAAGGGQDAFVARFNNPTSGALALTYRSYLGGAGTDTGFGIVVDASQNAYVVGSTNSSDFPAPSSATLAAKGTDAFLAKLNTNTTALLTFVSSTLLGGTGTDRGTSIALNLNGGVLVTGETNSADFPVLAFPNLPLLQAARSGPSDAFLANYGPATDLSLTVAASPSPVAIGNAATFTYSIKNLGPDSSTGAVVTIPVPAASAGASVGAFTSTSGSCASTGSTGAQTEICTLGTIAKDSSATITVGLTPTVITSSSGGTTMTRIPASVSMGGHALPGNSAVDQNLANNNPAAASDNVDYFTSAIAPPTSTVVAGKTATFTVTLTPHTPATPVQFPANITLGCVMPTTPVALAGASCTFTPSPVLTIPASSGTATSVLKITTTAPTQTAGVRRTPTLWYALWLPLCGVALLGAGSTRRRRWVTGAALVVLVGTISLLPACGSKASTTSPTGTQPGTYSIGITATSGSYVTPPSTSPLNISLIVTAP